MEWVLAAKWAGYRTFDFFNELDGDQQSFVIAAFQTDNQIQAVMSEAQRLKSEREARKPRGKSSMPKRL